MMQNLGLTELATRGNPYTWSIKHTTEIIYSRIDVALSNTEWLLQYLDTDLEILNLHISYHSPLKLSIQNGNKMKRSRPRFKFLNCTGQDPNFMDIVSSSWNINVPGRPMYDVWQNLLRLQCPLGILNKKMYQKSQSIQDSRNSLHLAQDQLSKEPFNPVLIHNVKDLTDEMILKIETEEKILMQKAKIDWIQLGDGNNKYFYANPKEKIDKLI